MHLSFADERGDRPDEAPKKSVGSLLPRKGGGGAGTGGAHGRGGGSGSSAHSPAVAKGAPASFARSRSANSFSLSRGGNGKVATPYGDGGGKPFKLKNGPFQGRQAGGGSRGSVYGTRTFGSGYPYGGQGYYVADRPLPYIFYPVPLQTNYYGGNEYLNVSATDRPGGGLTVALVQPSFNTSAVTYRIVGDNVSVSAVFFALAANCSVANSSNPSVPFVISQNDSTWPLPEQVVQWYRASTFALALDGYNNSAALSSNQPASNSSADYSVIKNTPLPEGLNATFLGCLNATVGKSVPLAKGDSTGLSQGAIVGIMLGSVLGAIVAIFCLLCLVKKCKSKFVERRYQYTEMHSAGVSYGH